MVRDGGRRSRGSKFQTVQEKDRYRLDFGKLKFANRVCESVSAETVNAFKAGLDHHLMNLRGYL